MQTQSDLFGLGALDVQNIFPQFSIEAGDIPVSRRLTNTAMRAILERIGFVVRGERYHIGEIRTFPIGEGECRSSLFEVSYPKGWNMTKPLEGYTEEDNPVRHLLDGARNLRGVVPCDLEKVPHEATLYTRYGILSGVGLNFAKVSFDRKDVSV